MIFQRLIFLFFSLLFIFGCTRASRLETALKLAGPNRAELQKVLDHYSAGDLSGDSAGGSGSLKYKAAIFLIENMPGHYSADSARLKPFYDSINSLLDARFKMKNNRDSILAYVQAYQYNDSMVVKDIETIKSSFLIRNIDSAFVAWSKPWAQHLSFEQFCEYILPYKYAEYQRLDSWRDSLNKRFYDVIERISENDRDYDCAFIVGREMNTAFQGRLKPIVVSVNNALGPISPFFNSGSVNRISFGDCNEYALVNVAMMRSAGVPAVFEYVPQWGERASGRHGWSTLYNSTGFIPTPHTDKDPGEVFFPTRKMPKIFRWRYALVPEREEYVKTAKYVHYDMAQFEKDVTAEYLPTNDVVIPVNTNGLVDKYAYIAVPNARVWNVVDFGVIKGKKAYFKNMGRGVVYSVFGYDGKELVAICDPFIIHNTGEVSHLKADTTSLDSVKLWRKHPRNRDTAHMEKRIIGGKIQASTDSLFTVDTTLYEIKDFQYPDLIPIVCDSAYRYWRYLGVPGSYATIAELQFFREGVDTMLMGRVFGAAVVNPTHAFDKNWLSYSYSRNQISPAWVAMDFGDTIRIKNVRVVPRSDDNAIHFGEVYELDYCVDGKWHSRPQQTAAERYLVFDSIPRNSLLLLKNLTRGQEERPFTYNDGKQGWW